MRGLATWTLKGRYVQSVLSNPDHPQFMKALEYATNHGYGRAKESVEVSGPSGTPITMIVEFVGGSDT